MKKVLPLVILFLLNNTGQCQLSTGEVKIIDSLKNVIAHAKNDTIAINAYKTWDDLIYVSDPELDLSLTKKIINLSQTSLKRDDLSTKEKYTLKKSLAFGYTNMGILFKGRGNAAKAMSFYLKSLKLNEEIKNKRGIAGALNNIGIIHYDQGDLNKAMEFYTKCLIIQEKIGDKSGAAQSLNNIGIVYRDLANYEKAMFYYNRSLKIKQKLGDKSDIAESLNNMGVIYRDQHKYEKAMEYYNQSLALKEEIGDVSGIAQALNNIANVYRDKSEFKKAIEYSKKALEFAKRVGNAYELAEIYATLYDCYKHTGQAGDALLMHELYTLKHDSLTSIRNQKEVLEAEAKYDYEKQKVIEAKEREKQKAIAKEKEKVDREKEKKQQIILWTIAGGLVLVLAFALFVVSRLRITRRQKEIIEKQKHLVEEKQKEIIDSINYAKRIQSAILAREEDIKKYFPKSFLLYLPKDIVAGDFYFFETTSTHVFYAAADCTGHGVPGALVSVVCSNALHRCITEFGLTEPGKILDKTRDLVLSTFEKSGQDVKDGMDISLISLKFKVQSLKEHGSEQGRDGEFSGEKINFETLQWSGANNPLWIYKSNLRDVTEIAANKQPIGKVDKAKPFTTHTFDLAGGDIIFLFTDGYADQFGGPQEKKFKYSTMQKLLGDNAQKEPQQIYSELKTAFENWKGKMEQLDDVCVIGIKI